jgi:FixJ family two-component response regulator
VLDVNLGGHEVSPLSQALVERGIPVIFVTGYERDALSNAKDAAAVLQKPVEYDALREALTTALGAPVQ